MLFFKRWLKTFEERAMNRERRKHRSQNFFGAIHIRAEGIILGQDEQNRILNNLKKHYLKS